MVEGPGCTLNGEKIRARVQKGQKVKEIRGSLTASNKTNPETSVYFSFHGCLYSGVETLGKELFMYFGLKALRVHFGMNGSMRVNPAERTGSLAPSLEIHLSRDVVCFYDSTVESRLSEDCERRVNAMRDLDVCSPGFSCSRSEAAVRQRRGGAMLCDVLLDQTVMPGVGNIIKNEALFDSGLHPAVKVEQLTDEQIRHVVKMTRDFTLLFYKCRKSGSALYKHYRVYKRPQCGRCSHVITVCRLGGNGRMTYFCSRCQTSNPSGLDTSKLPSRNILLSRAFTSPLSDDVAHKEEEDWTCPRCTLINPPPAAACDACLSPRPRVSKDVDDAEAASPSASSLIKYPCNAFKKPATELKVNWRSAFGTSTLVFSDLSDNPVNPPAPVEGERVLHKHGGVCQGTTSPNYASGGWQQQQQRGERSDGERLASYSQPSKKMRIDHSPFASNGAGKAAASPGMHKIEAKEANANAPPRCAAHRRPAALRVVHKDGENKGRRFYGCSLPRETKCNFFEWADLHFPLCHHGRRCVMRTVLKLGPNNGRSFYTCSLQKGKQCEFFQWAASGDENVF